MNEQDTVHVVASTVEHDRLDAAIMQQWALWAYTMTAAERLRCNCGMPRRWLVNGARV